MSYATAGAGHRRAAEAIAQAAAAAFPQARVECRDVLAFESPLLAGLYPKTYYLLVRHLAVLWGFCFELLDARGVYAVVEPIRRTWNRIIGRPFLRWLKEESFDVVVATHFLPADLFGAGKRAGWLTARVVVVVTDLHPHRFWLAPEADLFVVGTPDVAVECHQRGIAPQRVRVIGIPIAKGFHLPVDRSEVLRRFHLDPQRRTVLVTSGGMTVGPFEPVVEAILRLEDAAPGRIQLLVVCGENRAAAHRLERRVRDGKMPARVFGFVDNMPELMGASDLVVAKAGGLTVMETLSEGLPLILYHAIPGQERFNAQYVERSGAALWAHSPADVAAAVRRYLDNPAAFAVMRDAARRLSRPDAAETIVSQVIR
ncbi:MAG: glycosyltransferase [Candidatus Omnitrophica bacterium]|nr:glycosyltransferase [Candidatus Omnitrophota bacterium]